MKINVDKQNGLLLVVLDNGLQVGSFPIEDDAEQDEIDLEVMLAAVVNEALDNKLLPPTEQRCPHDGGYCHHLCEDECFRMECGMELSSPWDGYPKYGHKPVKEQQ